jgi:dipeptidyl aminopeptidase/acylaminoacyl peptidase
MNANRIDEPILLIHGEADNNSGTFPIESQRLFHALKGSAPRPASSFFRTRVTVTGAASP